MPAKEVSVVASGTEEPRQITSSDSDSSHSRSPVQTVASTAPPQVSTAPSEGAQSESSKASTTDSTHSAPPDPPDNDAAWREEVSARLGSYHSRRGTQEPRYPSLHLKFDESAPVKDVPSSETSAQSSFSGSATQSAAAVKRAPEPVREADAETADQATRVIHFPRSAIAPPRPLDELAEPVFDRPRIVEVPDVPPVPPALGGILIEHAEEPARERRPGYEIPLAPASMPLRMFAAGIDLVLVIFAVVLFGYIFFAMCDASLSRSQMAFGWLAYGIAFWASYQYLLLVFSGTTPGLKLAGLHLSRFDDSAASQRTRRWRALASMLSVLSLGLGYAWCFLDEDQLCWHDRITGTYLSPLDPGTEPHSANI